MYWGGWGTADKIGRREGRRFWNNSNTGKIRRKEKKEKKNNSLLGSAVMTKRHVEREMVTTQPFPNLWAIFEFELEKVCHGNNLNTFCIMFLIVAVRTKIMLQNQSI